ncbi:MAG TPA: ornithine carbamoyltransferase subunit F [Kineosporiaceae bacterium]
MAFNLRNRSILRELDFTPADWHFLLDLAAELKRAKYSGRETPRLSGKNLVLALGEGTGSGRHPMEVAVHDQGAHLAVIPLVDVTVGQARKDQARMLGRLFDGIVCCGMDHEDVEVFGLHSGVPVWNLSSSAWRPTQALSDVFTMREHCAKSDGEIAFAFYGDARSGLANSLLVTGAMIGMDVRIIGPSVRWNSHDVIKEGRWIADRTGARITHSEDIVEGAHGVDYVYTDSWFSPGEPRAVWNERVALLRRYQITMDVLRATGNARVKFMHSLPAFHTRRTDLGNKVFERTGMDSLEVTDEVFESSHSIVFDQVENVVHMAKAVLLATLGS